MTRNTNLHDNFEVNFIFKGFTSILIGIYFFILSYAYKYLIDSFLIEEHPLSVLTPQMMEVVGISLALIFVLFCSFSLFFSGRRVAKSFKLQLWNGKTRVAFWKFFLSAILLFVALILLMKQDLFHLITPTFLIIYALFIFIIRNKSRSKLLILGGLSFLLSVLCFIIPTYWYSAFTILAIAHITYGVVER